MNKPRRYQSKILKDILNQIPEEEQYITDRKMLIASKISRALERKGIRKKQFANMMRVQPSVITRWLSGTHNFTIETLAKIEYLLNINLLNTTTAISLQKYTQKSKFAFSYQKPTEQIAA